VRVLQEWACVALEGRHSIPIEVIVVDSKYTRVWDRDAWRKNPPRTAQQSYKQMETSRVFVTLPKVSTCPLISQMVMSYVPLNGYLNKFESQLYCRWKVHTASEFREWSSPKRGRVPEGKAKAQGRDRVPGTESARGEL